MNEVRLNPLDTAWLFTESRATPNHVGGLLQFRLPADAPRDFVGRLMADFRAHRHFVAPWNRRLKFNFTKNPVPAWVEEADDAIDLEYHVRHAALPFPGGERELGELVGRLQSTPLDLSRPPWECTLIEGLDDGRFALFVKIHHALIDGISGMKLLQRAMAPDAGRSLGLPPFWASGAAAAPRRERAGGTLPTVANATAAAVQALGGQARSVPHLLAAFGKMLRRVGDRDEGMALPFDAPHSALNGRVREKRRFATQQFELARLRALAEAAHCTLNDIVLALCGGALRRFLLEREALPEAPLTAGIPVSVRPRDDEGTGNAITFIVATLGTDLADAGERLQAVRRSVQHAKAHVQGLPRQAMLQYTMLLMAPTILTLLSGAGGRMRPMFNVTISNVPGPDKPLFFRGAELVAIYPVSIVTHGQALNITCESYAGQMNFGFTGCHASLPSLQRLAVYAADALQELEAAVLPRAGRAAAGARQAATRQTGAQVAAKAGGRTARPSTGRATVKTAGKTAGKTTGKAKGKAKGKAAGPTSTRPPDQAPRTPRSGRRRPTA
ncbi:MAG: wax ester/triacylglycerol synthase family O-acyltransferase [Rubrivivax sp.]|nr:wax ester/triacylglycerol synthase family O-acyltransferase [Rubrivivax sp.]